MSLPYLIVRARDQLCALPVQQVLETLRLPELSTRASEVKGWLGTTMLRGDLVAVLDLGVLLGFEDPIDRERGLSASRAVSMCLGDPPQEQCALFAVDEVIGVKMLAPEHLQRIALPGGGELAMGRFDADFARLVEAWGLVAREGLVAGVAAAGVEAAGVAAVPHGAAA